MVLDWTHIFSFDVQCFNLNLSRVFFKLYPMGFGIRDLLVSLSFSHTHIIFLSCACRLCCCTIDSYGVFFSFFRIALFLLFSIRKIKPSIISRLIDRCSREIDCMKGSNFIWCSSRERARIKEGRNGWENDWDQTFSQKITKSFLISNNVNDDRFE